MTTSEEEGRELFKDMINEFCTMTHEASKDAGWWELKPTVYNHLIPTKLCLIHSEISEAMEAHRKGDMDSHLPNRRGIEVELADAVIRITDLAGALGLDLGGAIVEKMVYNKTRADHKLENRTKEGGKAY